MQNTSDPAPAIRLESVSKRFLGSGRHYTFLRVLQNLVLPGAYDGERPWSLVDISLDVPRGELVGVVGENGAGKTTLLKTMAGLYLPSKGRIFVNGEVALIAGLGAGMIDELSVADNVWLYGAVCRIRRARIRERFDEILAWAELEAFVDAELRTLSMGMRTRLAFAITMQIGSDTLLLDEAFSAGDKRFQERCNRFFSESRSTGRTFVIATHNLEFVRAFCSTTLWLHRGRKMSYGPTADVLEAYRRFEDT